jgi:hypothetical protein
MLTGQDTINSCARALQDKGPQIIVIKKGSKGAILFSEKDLSLPQVEHLKNIYFYLLNSAFQNSLTLNCPFDSEKVACPIRKKLFEIMKC